MTEAETTPTKQRLLQMKGTQFTPTENKLMDDAADYIAALEAKLAKARVTLRGVDNRLADMGLSKDGSTRKAIRQALEEIDNDG